MRENIRKKRRFVEGNIPKQSILKQSHRRKIPWHKNPVGVVRWSIGENQYKWVPFVKGN